ncbi:MAG: CBS domain-containing protein, partial [Clostridia bacterium]|nr:CBS domain-containing protein [Clostridia bacterium]
VETVGTGNTGIRLSTESAKLATLHPSDLADIIEDFDKYTQAAVFATLDEERAADVLEELEPDAQMRIIHGLSVSRAADVLERMPSDEVADILDVLTDDKAEEILAEMESETSDEVRELMEYDDNTVGSIMSTDYVTFNKDLEISEVLRELRSQKPELDTIFYLYIVNNDQKLIATVSLRDLVVSEPETKLSQIMNANLLFVYDHDTIDALTEIVSKYSLFAVPVVDDRGIMLGIVVINDVVYNLLRSRRKRL